MRQNIIIVANRLPFSIQNGPNGLLCKPSPGGLAGALTPVRERHNATWIGWAGLERPLTTREQRILPPYAHAVAIPTKFYHDYYYTVANSSLWPILHGISPRTMYSTTAWSANLAVNQQFSEQIAQTAQPQDSIWIHDFHLIMLPKMLRQAGLTNQIGFFLHVPVTDPQLFATLPDWKDMLRSLQAVNLCGVQTKRDAVNLHKCFALAGLRAPHIMDFPIGIDHQPFSKPCAYPAVEVNTKTVVLSVSRLDYTKGIIQQLEAVNALLNQSPDKTIIYKLIVAPSREALTEYRELKQAVDALVSSINSHYPGAIDYSYRNFDLPELTAWYKRADIMLVAPVVDGMNLVAKEYIAAREKPGVLVLSKYTGAAAQLADALLVDPHDAQSTFAALQQALTMPEAEQTRRHRALRNNVLQEDVFAWAEAFLAELERI